MITDLIISAFSSIATLIMGLFPIVTLSDLPVVGDELSSVLTSMVLMWNTFLETFPYAVIVWDIFLFVILPFEGLLLLLRFLLGNRRPIND